MKKAVSLLLGVMLICSLSGFTYASDPYRAYENAANRAYKSGNFEAEIVVSGHTAYGDGTTESYYSRTHSRELGAWGDRQSVAETETLTNGRTLTSTSYFKDGWYYEKLNDPFVFPETKTATRRTVYTEEAYKENFWNLIYDGLGAERLAASMFSFGSDNRTINIRVPREQANDWLAQSGIEGVEADRQIDGVMVRVTLDDKGNIAQEELTVQSGFTTEKGWAKQTFKTRTFFKWPADETPIVFPDDLDSYTLPIEE